MDITIPSPSEESDSVNHAPQQINQQHRHKPKPPPPKPKPKPAVAAKPQLRNGVPVKRDANQMLLATVGRTGGTAAPQTTSMEVDIQPHRTPPPPTTRKSPPRPPRQNKSDTSLSNQAMQPPVVSRSQAVISQMPVLPVRTRASPQPSHPNSMDEVSNHRPLPVLPPDTAGGQVRTSPVHGTPTTARAPAPRLPSRPMHQREQMPGMFNHTDAIDIVSLIHYHTIQYHLHPVRSSEALYTK